MPTQRLIFADQEVIIDLTGIVVWPGTKTAIVADLHFEKATSMAVRHGTMLPPFDTRATLDKLGRALAQYQIERVIALGDSFHDQHGPARLGETEIEMIERLTNRYGFLWITGNHDPCLPDDLPGDCLAEYQERGIVFRHEADPGSQDAAEFSGHFHPKARIRTPQKPISAPCFAFDDRRLMLPSFGVLTGGLNVLNAAVRPLFNEDFRVSMLGQRRLFAFSNQQLEPDRAARVG
ncbi:MAG: ligase-associated DNA damage response endonuclease PdeM [Pseudomonadota bacterium]